RIDTFVPNNEQDIPSQLLAHTDPHQRRLDISQAPLFAANIAHDPIQNEWLLALCFHHLVSDHMTLELIIAEISELLHSDAKNSYSKNKHAENLPVTLPYRHFVAQSLRVPASEHETYFRDVLADVDAPTAPFGIRDVHSGDRQVTEATQSLDTALAQAIRTQARRQGISPSVLFHIAWAQVLAKVSGRDDVVFGTVLLGRMQGSAGIERALGVFINTLPIRVTLAGLDVLNVVQETYRSLSALFEHEQAPLALAQRCSGVAPPLPLFSTLLNYRHSKPDSTHTTWEGIRLLAAQERTHYPISLSVDDLGKEFQLVAQAMSDIDPASLLAYMITALTGLVDALETHPQRPIATISILPATERQQLLVDFNATQSDFPQDALIHQLFENQVQRSPEATAVVFEEQSLSYHELNRRANQLAHHLIAFGVRPDDRVAIYVKRSLDMLIGLLGILKASAGYVPLDPEYPTERLAYILSDCAPKLLLTQQHLQHRLSTDVPVWIMDNDDHLAAVEHQSVQNPEPHQQGLAPHHLAYVIYTSGSTGQPKGVMIEHHNVVNFVHVQCQTNALTPSDRVLQLTSVAFDTTVSDIFATLTAGATLVLRPDHLRLPDIIFSQFLQQQEITVSDLPTAFWHLWVQEMAAGRCGFSPSLRLVIVGGEKAELRHFNTWQSLPETQSCQWINSYGPTETTVIATVLKLDNRSPCVTDIIPIGYPLANTSLYILDTQGQPVPIGVAGEIYIGGAGVARGYLNRPELTAERFVPDLFSGAPETRMYKTGDLGRWLPDGNIEYLGRNDFQVKLRGFRIELGEIETQLVQCHGVREAVVIARGDDTDQKRLVA
ncbi:non-ribosomal peptide synthetase, partial [Xenorhabdus lircayensis]